MPKCTSARCNSCSAIPDSPLADVGRATEHTCRQEAYRAWRIMRMDGFGVNSQPRPEGLIHRATKAPWIRHVYLSRHHRVWYGAGLQMPTGSSLRGDLA